MSAVMSETKKCIAVMLLICITAICTVLLSSCEKKQAANYDGFYVYGMDANETRLMYEEYSPKSENTEDLIDEFIDALKQEPGDVEMKKAIPDEVDIENYVLDDNSIMSIYFNAAYSNYSGINEILRRAAIVKTLCQIDDIESICFFVSGQPLTNADAETIGLMTADTFIDMTDTKSKYQQTASLNIFFADSSGTYLVDEPVEITYDATIPLEQLAIEQLISGPESIDGIEKGTVISTIPEGTVLNKISVMDYTCYVDFSKEFLDKPVNISNEVAIYSVVNTLIELPNINKVQFSIDGEQVLKYNDSMVFGEPFERNLDYVGGEK